MLIGRLVALTLVATVALLTACSSGVPQARADLAKPDHDLVAAIRAAGEQTQSSVEVHALRDPALDGFLHQAEQLESQNNFPAALEVLERALALAPQAPDLLQLKAELMVGLKHYGEAEALARQSYELGARLGSLCARNWQTVIETRRLVNDTPSVDSAKAQLETCRIAPRPRY